MESYFYIDEALDFNLEESGAGSELCRILFWF